MAQDADGRQDFTLYGSDYLSVIIGQTQAVAGIATAIANGRLDPRNGALTQATIRLTEIVKAFNDYIASIEVVTERSSGNGPIPEMAPGAFDRTPPPQ